MRYATNIAISYRLDNVIQKRENYLKHTVFKIKN